MVHLAVLRLHALELALDAAELGLRVNTLVARGVKVRVCRGAPRLPWRDI